MLKINNIIKNRFLNKNIKCRLNKIKFNKVKRTIFYLYNLDKINYSNYCIYYSYQINKDFYYYKIFNNKGNMHSFKKDGQYLPAEIIYERNIGEERFLFYENGRFISYDIYNINFIKNAKNK